MIVIFGQRYYGRVDGHGAEYVATKFAHVYWLPLVPTQSTWVSRRVGDQIFGFEVAMSARSVAAGYLRVWGPILALAAGATLSVAGFVVAAVLLALTGWSWSWLRIRNGRERRRAVFNQVVFGTACDPLRRRAAECEGLRPVVEQHFAEVSGGRTPDDVTRFGAETPLQAAFAYASLRVVAATTRRDTARKARDASERVLDGLKESDAGALADGGPYRARGPAPDLSTGAFEEAAAASLLQQDRFVEAQRPPPVDAWQNHPDNPAVKAEIAANKKARAGKNLVIGIAVGIGAAVVGGFAIRDHLDERAAAAAGMVELRRFRDDLCNCTTVACQVDLSNQRMPAVERAEKAANEIKSNRSDLEDLANDVQRCVNAVQ